jgi:L-asparaginase II
LSIGILSRIATIDLKITSQIDMDVCIIHTFTLDTSSIAELKARLAASAMLCSAYLEKRF